jgi:prevent-host-death family protein
MRMAQSYSTYEAKARFSEVMRKVRGGQRVVITFHGKEVAEIRPLRRRHTLGERIRRLEERGILSGPVGPRRSWKAIANRPGALERFLAERE